MFAQSHLSLVSEPEDRISSPVLEASIGARKVDEDCFLDDDDDIEDLDFVLESTPRVVKTPDSLRQNGIPLDIDGPHDFQPKNVPFNTRVIHLPDNFWSRPLPANLERPTSCSCQACQQNTKYSSTGGETPQTGSDSTPLHSGLKPEWSTPLRFFLLLWPFEFLKSLAKIQTTMRNSKALDLPTVVLGTRPTQESCSSGLVLSYTWGFS